MENFICSFCKKYNIKEEDAKFLFNIMKVKKFHKKDMIIKEGEVCNQVFVVKEGLTRGVRFENQESTICIIVPGQAFYSAEGFSRKEKATISVQAITDCSIFYMDCDEYNELSEKYPVLYNINLNVLEECIVELTNLQVIFMDFPNTADRYLELMKLYPELDKQIPLKYVASFLGIATQSLSRIRKELKAKKIIPSTAQ
jgi:CRP/FNR family transcriptional regulator, anaerobic regulatory protein